jgi:hypothetical protein
MKKSFFLFFSSSCLYGLATPTTEDFSDYQTGNFLIDSKTDYSTLECQDNKIEIIFLISSWNQTSSTCVHVFTKEPDNALCDYQ